MIGRSTRAARLPSAGVTERPDADQATPPDSAPVDPPQPGPRDATYDERLSVPWWWWPPALGVAVLLAAEIHMGYPGVRAWAPYLLLAPLFAAALVGLGRTRVRVADGELHVGQAHVPLRFLGEVEVVSGEAKREALGPELDPAAYLVHRPWIGPVVRVRLTDPEDPTPYWVFSTRRPAALARALSVQDSS